LVLVMYVSRFAKEKNEEFEYMCEEGTINLWHAPRPTWQKKSGEFKANLYQKKTSWFSQIWNLHTQTPDHCEYHSMLWVDATTRQPSQVVPNIAHGTHGWHPNHPNLDQTIGLKPMVLGDPPFWKTTRCSD
jgi:hypothetical protein